MRKIHWLPAAAALTAVTLVATSPDVAAKRATRRPSARVVSVVTPAGLQGLAGSGGNIVFPFAVVDLRGAPTDVRCEYGVDRNADGAITEDEFRPATEDRLDYRNSRANRYPQVYRTGSDGGSWNSYVWKSQADLGASSFPLVEFALTPQGRLVPDPDNPGSFLFSVGPGGTPQLSGVKLRVRTVLARSKHRPRLGDFVTTEPFSVDNRRPPSMTVNSVEDGPLVLAHWTVFDRDSEDLNGNGEFDIADGEDANGNGQLDVHRAGVAFDFCSLAPGQDVSSLTAAQLEKLQWRPCTRAAGVGDNDSLETTPGLPIPETGPLSGVPTAPPGVGRSWTFAWDAEGDLGTVVDDVILRATPFDETRARGKTVYWLTRVHPGE